MRLKITT